MSVTYNNILVEFDVNPPLVTFLQGADMEIDTVRDNIRVIEQSEEARMQESYKIIDAYGNIDVNPLNPGTEFTPLGISVLNPYVATFETGIVPFYTSGGNLVANLVDMAVTINNAVGAISLNSQDIEYSSYGNAVTVRATSGNTGTEHPTGTLRQPVDNIPDAMTIAVSRGFAELRMIGDYTFDTGDSVGGMLIVGQAQELSLLTINTGAAVTGAIFKNCNLTGVLDGNNTVWLSQIANLQYFSGIIKECLINPGTIYLDGGAYANITDCASAVDGSYPIIDMGGSGQGLGVTKYSGGLQINNKTGTDTCEIGLSDGELVIDSTVTNGTIKIWGTGTYTNNSTSENLIIDDDGLVNGTDTRDTRKMVYNNVTRSGTLANIINDNGVDTWKTFELAGGGRVQQ